MIANFRPCLCGCVGEMDRGDVAARNLTEEMERPIGFFAFSGRIKFI